MTDMERAREIAAGLSANARRLCLEIKEYDDDGFMTTARLLHTNVKALAPLLDGGLATSEHEDGWGTSYTLTPLGQAVAQALSQARGQE